MKVIAATLLAAALCGCATEGGRCYPILGFGWVTVNTNQVNVTVVKTTLLGAGMSTLPPTAIVGFGQTTAARVTTNVNTIIEIK